MHESVKEALGHLEAIRLHLEENSQYRIAPWINDRLSTIENDLLGVFEEEEEQSE
jgi:hypothetical protein